MIWLIAYLMLVVCVLYFTFSICPENFSWARRKLARDICVSARMPYTKICAI